MPVYDQFEVAALTEFSGCMTDSVFKGTIFGSESLSRKIIALKSTGLLFREMFFNSFGAMGDLDMFTSGANVGSNNRYSYAYDSEERYYDTLIAHPAEYVVENGGSIIRWNPIIPANPVMKLPGYPASSSFGFILGAPHSGLAYTASFVNQDTGDNVVVSDNVWLYAYPFENRYLNLRRLANVVHKTPKNYATQITGAGDDGLRGSINATAYNQGYEYDDFGNPVYSTLNKMYSFGFAGPGASPNLNTTYNYFYQDLYYMSGTIDWLTDDGGEETNSLPNFSKLLKAFFGFGDGPGNSTTGRAPFLALPWPPGYAGVVSRGWKYGLYSALPEYTYAIYRRAKYGQFRDMLEQRKQCKAYNETENTIVGGPVEIRFVDGTAAAVTASLSSYNSNSSGIYDKEYKSGHPFRDP